MFPYREDRSSSRGTRNSGRGILETLDWNHRQELGRGSFGVVYKIQRIGGHNFRAVKCIRRTRTQDTDQEWRVLEHLGYHKNIIKCYSHQNVVLDGATHLAIELEYIDGSDLVGYMWSFFDNNQSLSSAVTARFTAQILAGLMYIHSNGYAHCDIKPDNIMLTKAFEVKIADFGLATFVGNHRSKKGAFGTISYLGPECFADDLQGFSSDMWALGVTVFNMCFMGHDPFHPITKQEIDHRARRFLGHPLYGTNFIEVQRKLIFEHFSRILWPMDIDTWSRQRRDAFDFITRLLTVDTRTRITASQALCEPWMTKQRTRQGPPVMYMYRPREEVRTNSLITGVHGLRAPRKPNRREGARSRISKFVGARF